MACLIVFSAYGLGANAGWGVNTYEYSMMYAQFARFATFDEAVQEEHNMLMDFLDVLAQQGRCVCYD